MEKLHYNKGDCMKEKINMDEVVEQMVNIIEVDYDNE